MGWILEKPSKTLGFLRFFEVLGWLEGMIEASWGWNRPKILFWVDCLMHFWTCWRQDGEKDGQDGDQEAQDGRWKAKMGLQMDTRGFGSGAR